MIGRIVELHSRSRVNDFLRAYHYLGHVTAWKAAFGLLSEDNDLELDGVVVIGLPLSRVLMGRGYLEIRRLCVRTGAPKNSCTRLLGYATRWSAKHGYRKVVSYADPSQGHTGTIYLAANFHPAGQTKAGHWRRTGRDRRVHDTGSKLRFVWETCRRKSKLEMRKGD